MRLKSNAFKERFEKLMPIIRDSVFKSFQGVESKGNYKIIWDHFQRTAIKKIVSIIKEEFPNAVVKVTKSKSTYPDIKIIYGRDVFAIDIKSNESGREPWYDIARLDTIFEKRLDKYAEEYDIVIKYDRDTGKVENVFFEPMYRTVGIYSDSGGVKYRPYDGKLRPKSWEMFEAGTAYWDSKERFIWAVRRSLNYRRRKFIEEWWKELPKEDKEELKKLLCRHTLDNFPKK